MAIHTDIENVFLNEVSITEVLINYLYESSEYIEFTQQIIDDMLVKRETNTNDQE